ncbi:MAG TPA: carbamoyltransferase C-terminal domain-containing protein [Vicinamibacteria bacterium]|nr:carbamoyltransferase C-terminal domain-containing protein [Vicinamibacteria bacterium]
MPILGIWDGHDAGAALVDESEGRIVCAANEERFTRRKLEVGFPFRAIEACLSEGGLAAKDVEDVAVSTFDPAKTLTRILPSLKENYYLLRRRKVRPRALDSWKRAVKYELTTWKPNGFTRSVSERAIAGDLARAGLGKSRIHWSHHHRAHAATAAYTSGFDSALVVTLDGVGDGLSGTLSTLAGGKLKLLSAIRARDSFGIFYEMVTRLLNMRELEDEGKVMALASFGYAPPDGRNRLRELFEVDGQKVRCRMSPHALQRFLAVELAMMPSEQFAFLAQETLETKVVELVANALRATGMKRIAYAGGVASNIQVNRRIRALPQCEGIFVFPHMGDGGLALGAALARAVEKSGARSYPLGDLRLGPSLKPGEIENALRGSGLRFRGVEDPAEEAARRIGDGDVVFWFQGRMEFGPRALGGRSILARPDSESLRDRLNLKLKRRVWYQPFCPSMLDEEAERLLEGGATRNRFMTMAYGVREEGRELLKGVMGRDGTCRPQMVDESYGPYHRLLVSLRERIGVGALLNTSFNLHGEPLVASPPQAIDCFLRSGADVLVMGDFVVEACGASS